MEIPKIILKPTINAICRIESMFWPIIIGIILIVSFFIQEIYHLAYITIILFVYKTCVEISKSKKRFIPQQKTVFISARIQNRIQTPYLSKT